MISLTHGIEYQYQYDNNKTCIEVKTDVEFTLTNGNETIKFDGKDFNVTSGDCASSGEAIASLMLTNVKKDSLSIIFQYDAQNQATMDVRFTFAPFEYFPETQPKDQIQMIDNGDLILGEKTRLFKCNSSQRITLNGKLEDTIYTMYMDMSNTQIQAFDIMDGNLSSNG